MFPASSCLKVSGHFGPGKGASLTMRGCALDSGSLTADTEIVRMSHCGTFYFQDRYVAGCIQVCDDMDGCNMAHRVHWLQVGWGAVILCQLLWTWGSYKNSVD
eukprot:TRINITY_DN60391_c0_g1_i1.p1 TRINITY_DN60391_c0_g1~~TRINITY_DN60391_c0_g1_i1.p1  ORF type:complete len:103 (-),score=21.56 TRINITY_DN60391_c0_g1_i1:52-360(-)